MNALVYPGCPGRTVKLTGAAGASGALALHQAARFGEALPGSPGVLGHKGVMTQLASGPGGFGVAVEVSVAQRQQSGRSR